ARTDRFSPNHVMAHPQLPALHLALDDTERRAHALAARAGQEVWMRAPGPDRWSPSECVQHLIATLDAIQPRVDEALAQATPPAAPVPGPFSPDLMGRLLIWTLEPPYRMRMKTGAAFVPADARPPAVDLSELVARHEEWRARMRRAVGHPIDRLRIPSPFAKGISYSIYSTFCIVPVHERRHLWQA